METINIVLAPDNNYARHASAVMASVLQHNKCDVVFWILDGGISEENKKNLSAFSGFENYTVKFLEINPDDFSEFPESGYISRAMWYRLKIASLIPDNVGVCLYLDCDTIVCSSLEQLFLKDLSGYYVAGAMDCVYEKFVSRNRKYFPKNYRYFNSGVLLLNLSEWRKNGVEEMIFDFLKKNPDALKLLDQTVLNITLQNKVLELPIAYNLQWTPKYVCESSYYLHKQEYYDAMKAPIIVHFVNEFKPWKVGLNALNPFYKKYFDALQFTQWKLSDSEESRIIDESESGKKKAFRTVFFKNLKRKPWSILRLRFWQRVFLG